MKAQSNSVLQRATKEFPVRFQEYMNRLEIVSPETGMSWNQAKKGFASLTLEGHKEAGWIQIVAREVPEGEGAAQREVFFTIEPRMVEALRIFLDETFPRAKA